MDTDNHVRDHHNSDIARHHRADTDVEVHCADARHIAALQNGRANLRSLLIGQINRTGAAGLLLPLSATGRLLLSRAGLLLCAGLLLRLRLPLLLLSAAWRLGILALLGTAGLLGLALLLRTLATTTSSATLLRTPATRCRRRRRVPTTATTAARATATTATGTLRGHNTGARQQSGGGHCHQK